MLDPSVFIGQYPFRHLPHPDPDVLVKVMAREGITRAWVGYLPAAFHRDPTPANVELHRLLAPFLDRLVPAPATAPPRPARATGKPGSPSRRDADAAARTRWLNTTTQQLLARYGILTRETAAAESIEGGFSGLYPVLKALEENGRIRRGYFVAGLGATQFAMRNDVDRLKNVIMTVNVAGVPLLVGVIALLLALRRKNRPLPHKDA